jgi:hypothetical protein
LKIPIPKEASQKVGAHERHATFGHNLDAAILCGFLLELAFFDSLIRMSLNSLAVKSVPAGTKNSRAEGFLLAKHKHTNIPTMMGPFPPPAAWL